MIISAAGAGSGVRESRVCNKAWARRMPDRATATRCPSAGLSKPWSEWAVLTAERYGCSESAATVPRSASQPMYAKTMRGVAGIGSRPLASHHAVNCAQCRPYWRTVLSSRADAARRTAVVPPVHAPTLPVSHSKCEPLAARKLSSCRARGTLSRVRLNMLF